MEFAKLLKLAVNFNATDVILKTGCRPKLRVNGDLHDMEVDVVVSPDLMTRWIKQSLPNHLQLTLEQQVDADYCYLLDKTHRCRINLYRQRQTYSMVVRLISGNVPSVADLGLPSVLEEIALYRRGLVLVTGATGSGKSTTLAAMIQHINRKRRAHIITIEDPIEFDFQDKKSTISQREVGIDVGSYEEALRSSLRQNPDVLVIGELRDKVTVETALKGAETGHLVLGTLHTFDSVETLTRLVSYFPHEQQTTLRMQLASTLRAIISQRLVKARDKTQMVAANEILTPTSFVRDIILRGDTFAQIYDAIRRSTVEEGMLSFDDCLFNLYERGIISSREALRQATRPNDLRLRLIGIGA